MPTNRERLVLQLKRRERVCDQATRAMIEDLKKVGVTSHEAIYELEVRRLIFLNWVRDAIKLVPDPDLCHKCKNAFTYIGGLCKNCYEPLDV